MTSKPQGTVQWSRLALVAGCPIPARIYNLNLSDGPAALNAICLLHLLEKLGASDSLVSANIRCQLKRISPTAHLRVTVGPIDWATVKGRRASRASFDRLVW